MTIPLDPEEGRRLYGTSPAAYAQGRPDYPGRIYRRLANCGLAPGARVLEIGPGTGLVTQHLLAAGARVTAVEANAEMAAHLRSSVDSTNLEVIAVAFEDAPMEEGGFDLAVAATSFHWVAQPAGWTKLSQALRPGAWAVIWWMLFQDHDQPDDFDRALHEILGGDPALPATSQATPFQLQARARKAEIAAAGLVDVEAELVRASYVLSAGQMRSLYATTAIVLRREKMEQEQLLDRVQQLVLRDYGGQVERHFVTASYRGRKPS